MIFNDAITPSKLPSSLNMTNMKAVFKKGTIGLKETYKPINTLPLISTILERIVCKQLINFFIIFYRNISADLEKVLVHNTV